MDLYTHKKTIKLMKLNKNRPNKIISDLFSSIKKCSIKLEIIYLIKFSLNFILFIKPQNGALFFLFVSCFTVC